MSRRLAVLTVALLSCAAFGVAHSSPMASPAGVQAPAGPATFTDADRKAFHDALTSSRSMRDLLEMDPVAFKVFEDGLLADLAAGKVDESGARKRGYDFAVAARAKMMSNVNKAPDADYLAFVQAQLAAMKLLGGYNTKACYEFVELGGISEATAATLGQSLLDEVVKVGYAQVAAAKAGARTPNARKPASEAEIEAAVQSYVDMDGPVAWLQGMGDKTTDKLTADQRCDGATKWITAILAQPPATAARLLMDE